MHMRESEAVQEICRRKDRYAGRHHMIIRKIGLIFCLILVAVLAAFVGNASSAYAACTLQNPIVSPRQDPSIWYANGLYYLVQNEPLANRAFSSLDELEQVQAERCRFLQAHPELIRGRTACALVACFFKHY
jgi:hypothetical protein